MAELAAAGGIVLFTFVGRTGIDRWLPVPTGSPLAELRLWALVVLAAALLLLLLLGHGRVVWSPLQGTAMLTATAGALFIVFALASGFWASGGDSTASRAYELSLMLLAYIGTWVALGLVPSYRIQGDFWKLTFIVLGSLTLVGLAEGIGADGRLAVLGGGPNVFGRFMGLAVLACMARALVAPRRIHLWLLAVPSALLLVLSGSRGAMLATAAGIVVYLGYAGAARLRLTIGFGVVAAGIWLAINYSDFGARAAEMYQARIVELLVENRYTAGRSEIYEAALDMGLQSPVTGVGIGSFTESGYVYPHNLWLEAFVDTGGFGVLVLAAFVAGIALHGLRRRKAGPNLNLGAFVLILTASQFSGDLFDSRAIWVFGMFVLADRLAPRRGPSRDLAPRPLWATALAHSSATRSRSTLRANQPRDASRVPMMSADSVDAGQSL